MPVDYLDRFHQLTTLLNQYRALWQLRSFHHRALPWRAQFSELATDLEALSESELTTLETSDATLHQWLHEHSPIPLNTLAQLIQIEPIEHRELQAPARMDTGIPGRKWSQIQAFVGAISTTPEPTLEWCAGKGHLGRLLSATHHCRVTSLEWQSRLCNEGRDMAHRWQLPVDFVEADALHPDSAQHLAGHGRVVALHACGELHNQLLHHWLASACHSLYLSPCCYQLIPSPTYVPMSQAAIASGLQLDKQDLQLAVKETVTAGQHDRQRRLQERWWRLSFDEWQRHHRQADTYLPVPAFPKQLLNTNFTTFCQALCEQQGLIANGAIDEARWLEQGAKRVELLRRLELISQLFRRPLEMWLVLDRVLYLQEQGAKVSVNTFCEKTLTPRNVFIRAERQP